MAVLTAFAISQPIFDLLARHPPFLVAHGVTGEDTLGLVRFWLLVCHSS